MSSSSPITSLAFLTPGNYPDDDPAAGLEATLQLFELAEGLGYDGGWVRQRHLEHGVSSAAVFLAAASQRTSRLELGTGVIPIGYENPLRLAEDLATADALSRGRLQPGFSTGAPHLDLLGDLVHEGDWAKRDLSYGRIARTVEHLRGRYLGGPDTVIRSPGNVQRPRVQPYSPGLVDRAWLGSGSARSAAWAGRRGLHLLTGNIVSGTDGDDFTSVQLAVLRAHAAASDPRRPLRVALGRVVVPTDSADRSTRARYREYAASRHERTLTAHGPAATRFAPDLVGSSDEIVEKLLADPVVAQVSELRLELPYEFSAEDYAQILTDVARSVAPALGWRPAAVPVPVPA
ncbi:Flavin-dependent oxidoreductase, luciferase family (includes alkanesulfonate monooxygenase SsuD and methylene tetrahydromethanopterin reductase) [Quadrisphaera granulorum]|uniref:Alkanesulfonate monooxygenase SsuD/methylene tetrahydromethanopterin reductase-like flavin-dependent oxidoreductase (Luciferase family) n=1 Tax=Quadrisphaera granulorum TaxID=317664 RepID=A0A315ZZD4_9ACTN|nr:LLM class flavin-dependent oxidoreductase [Quadrisphaera granulorum]PWJ50230.1 alkanesulfonate monooxygenase SsuD/methylene tetrahydromethanopterin reductase-like flavin-dependent oxidoreductase (luciferase family) [Quadrisphaera granulorum]SZE97996.1 Flavin-dependent oxidoreductase, luciferase family (includes alkanesulfonate monooxygenase SsuD and methylene tetrahydromethanopterin reductase) [Quadrisphaera granulorum]